AVCVNAADVALNLGTPAGGTYSGVGVSGTVGNQVFDPSVGTQTLTYTYSDGTCSNSATTTITVNSTDTDGDGIADCSDNCPLIAGQIGSACSIPGFVIGTIDANCVCVGQQCTTDLIMEFQTDANASQISWELRTSGTNILVQSGTGLPNNAIVTSNTCLPDGCYYLRVIDSGGDGIANGGYILRTTSGQRIIDNRNNFNSGGVSAVINNGGFCLPLGGDQLIYTSCDKLDWVNNQFLVAAPNTAVSAQWQVGNQTDDGYQFWIFDPNGTYGYTKFRNHATSDGFGPPSATRACHMQINNWSPNQIPANVLMNAKVRSRVNGINSAWGPVCRFKIDPIAAACPLTKLMDIPGNQFFSCGVTRAWGSGAANRVVARTVDGATQYQFRWTNSELEAPVVRTTTTAVLQLNWTPALPNGTYQVQVRAFKNGQWCVTSLPWGDECNVVITGSPVGQGMAPQATGSNSAAELAMFPNPNRGDLLTLSLSAVEEGVNTVSVDIYDLTGAVVSSRTIAVNDGMLYQVLDLKEMASGLYMVNITAGNERYTERLVISR
ncbi:MAG: T9SS type A sorting domain-containing protein, partial [Flavobacteriales bacterium]